MTQGERFHSIDIMKGILVFSMLLVNAMYLPDLIPWSLEKLPASGGAEMSGWVLCGFLFASGMTIPFIISKHIHNNLSSYDISRSIIGRSLVMITIGVLMVNAHRVDAELTGFNSYVWSLIMFISVFLVWNRYHEEENKFFTVTGLRFAGLALLVFLVFKFRSGSFENNGSLITGWWEVPGLAGWGYFIAAFTFLLFRNSIPGTTVVWLLFLILNIAKQLNLTDFMDPVRPFIGTITDGSIPFIIISGQITGLILKRFSEKEISKKALFILSAGTLAILSGVILKKLIISSLNYHSPAIALIITGICMILFLFVHWMIDLNKLGRWFGFLKPAGENPFTVYLFSFVIYSFLGLCRIHLFFFRQYDGPVLNVIGSVILAIIMMWLGNILIRLNIRLKI